MALTKVIGAGLGKVASSDLDGAVTINESSADVDFRVESNGNANMLFVDGGNDRVGIGTDSPDDLLHLRATVQTGASLRLENSSTSTDANTVYGTINFEGNDASAGASGIRGSIVGGSDNISGGMSLEFSTAAGNSSNTERMRITSAGNVGIGTTNPSKKFAVSSSGANGIEISPDDTTTSTNRILSYNRSTSLFTPLSIGADDIRFYIEDTERMRITSTGNVGIGTSSPLYELDVGTGSGSNSINIFSGSSDTSAVYFTDSTTGVGSYIGRLAYNHTTNAMLFTTNATERMRIDSSGNVGIGTSSPSQSWTGGAARTFQVQGPSSTITALRVNEASDTYGDLQLISSVSNEVALYNFNNGAMRFGTNVAERMRIDSSGNLLVGRTSTINGNTNTTSGTQIGSNGLIQAAVSGDTAIALQRLSTDGDIIQFRKDNTTVGSIGVASSKLHIASTGNSGLRFRDDLNAIIPCNSDGTNSDGDQNLGVATVRFKTLFLSEGIRLGGTGTANELDDYEEGTWTPSVTVGTATAAYGFYTKIGRQVFISGRISNFSNTTNNEVLYVQGLPFVDGSGNTVLFGTSMVEGVDKDFGYEVVLIDVNDRLRFFHSTNASADPLRHIDLDSSSSIIYFQGTYFV